MGFGLAGVSVDKLVLGIIVASVGVVGFVYLAGNFASQPQPHYAFNLSEIGGKVGEPMATLNPLDCKVNFDFSKVPLSQQAKDDFETCFISEPYYAVANKYPKYTAYKCIPTGQESCNVCFLTLAMKYNSTEYCNYISNCHLNKSEVDSCVDFILDVPPRRGFWVEVAKVNFTLILNNVRKIYPEFDSRVLQYMKKHG